MPTESKDDMERFRAIGCHVFAGGFTAGVKDHFDVPLHVERHGFGLRTAHEVWGVPSVLDCAPDGWPHVDAALCFGNPRCTGFSCVTAGYSADGHGPWARQCEDVRDLMKYGLGHYPVVVWESVQQAYSVGKPLLDLMTEQAVAKGYRVAHVFCNAATFGNCQQRKRYFYVAYPKDKQFNVALPDVSPYYPVLYDAIGKLRDVECEPWDRDDDTYHRDSYAVLGMDDWAMIPHLPTGWGLNTLAEYDYEKLTERFKRKWDERNSRMPFSMHCIFRCPWFRPCPTLKSSSSRLVHPWHHRTFTIGELSDIMGWRGKIPVGPDPVHQIAKGVCPEVGSWLAEQVISCLIDEWNGEEWDCSYDHKTGTFKGEDSSQMNEKIIDVTSYVGHQFDLDRYPSSVWKQQINFNVDPKTGKLLKPWKEITRRQTVSG